VRRGSAVAALSAGAPDPCGRGADFSAAWRLVSEITAHAAAIADALSAGTPFEGDNEALLASVLALIELERDGPVRVLPLPRPELSPVSSRGLSPEVWRRTRHWPRCRQCGSPVPTPSAIAVLETSSGEGVWSRDAPRELLRADCRGFAPVHSHCARWLPDRFVWWGVVLDR
jgi:hypothetical protein